MSALFNESPDVFLVQLDEMLMRLKNISKDEVETLISKRLDARNSKDWSLADEYRDQLEALGIELFDGSSKGWRVKAND